jgi:hypothetical protein
VPAHHARRFQSDAPAHEAAQYMFIVDRTADSLKAAAAIIANKRFSL